MLKLRGILQNVIIHLFIYQIRGSDGFNYSLKHIKRKIEHLNDLVYYKLHLNQSNSYMYDCSPVKCSHFNLSL